MKKLLFAAVLVGLLATSASAATIGLWSTGICSGLNTGCGAAGGVMANSLNDNNYQFIQRSDAGATGNNSSSTEAAFGTYLADAVGASKWIGPVPLSAAEPIGTYTVRTTFDLTGFIASTLVVSLDIAVDNSVALLINGGAVSPTFSPATCGASSAAAHPWCFEIFRSTTINNAQVTGGWLAGVNTIDFVITNTEQPSPTGIRIQAVGNATAGASGVPEPMTVGLVGIGLAGLGLLRRKRS